MLASTNGACWSILRLALGNLVLSWSSTSDAGIRGALPGLAPYSLQYGIYIAFLVQLGILGKILWWSSYRQSQS